jgi:hypothetical protein
MASIHHEVVVNASVSEAWAALRDVGAARALFAPVLVGSSIDDDVRTVTFANGMKVRERVLDIDDRAHRVAYTVLDAPGVTYHHASMQIVDDGRGCCRFVWITDFLPADARATIAPLVEAGARALKDNLELVDHKNQQLTV